MRRFACLLAFSVYGCASAGNTMEETTPRQATVFQSAETGTLLGDRPRAVGTTIAAPAAQVWLAVKKVYADLDIPVTVENPSAHQIGNANFFKSRQIGGRSMTEFVDCGSGMTGPKASTYRIYISLLTDVVTDGNGGAKIQTTFVPMGQDVGEGSTDKIPCGSTGRFETFFLDKVKAELGKS
jgi:hypothetical protein